MKAPRHSLLKMSDLQSGVETLMYVTDHDATALEARLAKAEPLLCKLLNALEVAFDRCEGDLLGKHHNEGTDAMLEAEAFLRATTVQCDPPCPEHLCREMSGIGACGLPDSADVSHTHKFTMSFQTGELRCACGATPAMSANSASASPSACQHDLQLPNCTAKVTGWGTAECSVCQTFWDLRVSSTVIVAHKEGCRLNEGTHEGCCDCDRTMQ